MMFSSNAFRSVLVLAAAFNVMPSAAELPVEIGSAENYVILTKAGISNVPSSDIVGNIAVSPIAATAMTGFDFTLDTGGTFSTSTQLRAGEGFQAFAADYLGNTHALLTTAVSDMEAAYTDAAGRLNPDAARINLEGGEIGGQELTPGVYTFQTGVLIGSDITFKGTSSDSGPTDVFIIQMTGSLNQADGTTVHLLNGVQAKNIFWQVAEEVVVEKTAHLEGILLVQTGVLFETGSSLNGRVLAQTACALQSATIVQPSS
jgi:hypothetical protein